MAVKSDKEKINHFFHKYCIFLMFLKVPEDNPVAMEQILEHMMDVSI